MAFSADETIHSGDQFKFSGHNQLSFRGIMGERQIEYLTNLHKFCLFESYNCDRLAIAK
jgi:hypothetical protein